MDTMLSKIILRLNLKYIICVHKIWHRFCLTDNTLMEISMKVFPNCTNKNKYLICLSAKFLYVIGCKCFHDVHKTQWSSCDVIDFQCGFKSIDHTIIPILFNLCYICLFLCDILRVFDLFNLNDRFAVSQSHSLSVAVKILNEYSRKKTLFNLIRKCKRHVPNLIGIFATE